eukprot:gb/GECG01003313.1/.p1 GENE.gb/GECG01003313.1/~~gb/GECG01003313.1/.p1  ORF type:complete len:663 (+),score=82.34 gb/GECG01003313.1/:1-1989(+)
MLLHRLSSRRPSCRKGSKRIARAPSGNPCSAQSYRYSSCSGSVGWSRSTGLGVIPHFQGSRGQYVWISSIQEPSIVASYSMGGLRMASSSTSMHDAAATGAAAAASPPTTLEDKDTFLDFDDAAEAFKSKSTLELFRSVVVLRLCSIGPLVRNARTLVQWSEKVFGQTLTYWPIKKTFFAHFCAGEDSESIKPDMDRLRSLGVGGILDYAAEADVENEEVEQRDLGVEDQKLQARTYHYAGEQQCDENLKITLKSLDTAAEQNGFAAVKVTSLGQPKILQHVSQIINENRRLFRKYARSSPSSYVGFAQKLGADIPPVNEAPFNPYLQLVISRDDFFKALDESEISISTEEAHNVFERMDRDGTGFIDYIEWMDHLTFEQLGEQVARSAGEQLEPTTPMYLLSKSATSLSQEQRECLRNMFQRSETLAQAAKDKGATIMFDAEQTYLQPAIDHVVLRLAERYNKERSVVYNTYQAYLTDCESRLKLAVAKARRDGYMLGVKLVRGAYMHQERLRAKEYNYNDPIHPSIEDTHACYNNCIRMLIDSMDISSFMVASHNEDSIKLTAKLMDDYNLNKDCGVYFGQLLGMCDHVSLTLGKFGYKVFKYVPYGPIREVMPYLIRRAEENGDMMSNAYKEQRLLRQEFLRRLSPFNSTKAGTKSATT